MAHFFRTLPLALETTSRRIARDHNMSLREHRKSASIAMPRLEMMAWK
jgi:hypothetical protein